MPCKDLTKRDRMVFVETGSIMRKKIICIFILYISFISVAFSEIQADREIELKKNVLRRQSLFIKRGKSGKFIPIVRKETGTYSFKVIRSPNKGFIHLLELRTGDIVEEINDESFKNARDFYQKIIKIHKLDSFSLSFKRGGKRTVYFYNIKEKNNKLYFSVLYYVLFPTIFLHILFLMIFLFIFFQLDRQRSVLSSIIFSHRGINIKLEFMRKSPLLVQEHQKLIDDIKNDPECSTLCLEEILKFEKLQKKYRDFLHRFIFTTALFIFVTVIGLCVMIIM